MVNRLRQNALLALFGGLLLAGWAGAASVTVAVGTASGPVGASVDVPILVRGAQDLGALQMDLLFEPSVVEPEVVEPGVLLAGLVDFNVVAPGRLRLAVATSQGVSGDGELVVVRFKTLAPGESPLTAEVVRAWEQATSFEMLVETENGAVVAGSGLPLLPLIVGFGGLLIVACTVLVVVVVRRGRNVMPPHFSSVDPPPVAAPPQPQYLGSPGIVPPPPDLPPSVSPPSGVAQPTPPPAMLLVVGGDHIGRQVPLGPRVRIGRAPDNDLTLADHAVSGHHAEVTLVPPRWILTDLGSTNGTAVNGVRVNAPVELREGDIIQIGSCRLQVTGV